jgi:hypothetical protein
MVFSQNLLYACTMKTIPAIETNRPTKKYRERKQECSLPRAKSPMHSSRFVQAQHFRVAPESRVTFSYPSLALGHITEGSPTIRFAVGLFLLPASQP